MKIYFHFRAEESANWFTTPSSVEVWGGAAKKWKGKFFVLVSPLKVLNKQFFHHSPIIL